MSNRVFMSYSNENKHLMKKIRANLVGNGIQCFSAPYNIALAADWRKTLRESIVDCDLFLLIGTSEAVSSKYVQEEVKIALDNHCPILPLVFPGVNLSERTDFAGVRRYQQLNTSEERLNQDMGFLFFQVCGKLNIEAKNFRFIDMERFPEIPENYVERPELEARALEMCFGLLKKSGGDCVVLYGIDGIGKTTLARKLLLHVFDTEFRPVWEISCSSELLFETQVRQFVSDWEKRERGAEQEIVWERVEEKDFDQTIFPRFYRLVADSRGVLLFDDVRDDITFQKIYSQFVEKHSPCILTTSRADLNEHMLEEYKISIPAFQYPETEKLMGGEKQPELKELHRLCGGIPLALVVARNYMSYIQCDISEYIAWLKQDFSQLLKYDNKKPQGCHAFLFLVVKRAWDSIRAQGATGRYGNAACRFIEWCSVLDASCIHRDDLMELAHMVFAASGQSDISFAMALSLGWNYSLLTKPQNEKPDGEKTGQGIVMAPIVQSIIQALVEEEGERERGKGRGREVLRELCEETAKWLCAKWRRYARTEYRIDKNQTLLLHSSRLISLLNRYGEEQANVDLFGPLWEMRLESAFYLGDFVLAEKSSAVLSEMELIDADVKAMCCLYAAQLLETARKDSAALRSIRFTERYFADVEHQTEYPIRWILCLLTKSYLYDNKKRRDKTYGAVGKALKELKKYEKHINPFIRMELEMQLKDMLGHAMMDAGQYGRATALFKQIHAQLIAKFGEEKLNKTPALQYARLNAAHSRAWELYQIVQAQKAAQEPVSKSLLQEEQEVLNELENVIRIYKQYAPLHRDLAVDFSVLASCYSYFEKYEECVQLCDEAQDWIANILRLPMHPSILEMEAFKVQAMTLSGQWTPLQRVQECEPWLERISEFKGADVPAFQVSILMILADCYRLERDYSNAWLCLDAMRGILKQAKNGIPNPTVYEDAMKRIASNMPERDSRAIFKKGGTANAD